MLAWADGLVKISPWVIVVLILVNGLTALNLTRVFRLLFGDNPNQKPVALQKLVANGITNGDFNYPDSIIAPDATAMGFIT